jgi:hypothetical protein
MNIGRKDYEFDEDWHRTVNDYIKNNPIPNDDFDNSYNL